MDKNACKIHQESEESKSREVSYSSEDFSSLLRDISRKNMNRIKIGQLNINSIRNKFDLLVPAVVRNLDILLITETKIDSSFPEGQFEIDGFTTPYRVDRDCHGGGILSYIRQGIRSTLLINLKISENLEGVFVELNFRRKKWLICCSCNPQKSNIMKHLDVIGKKFELYSSRYENYLLLGDFNSEPSENAMIEFRKPRMSHYLDWDFRLS